MTIKTVGSIKEFMSGSYSKEENKIIAHCKKYGKVYEVAGLTVILVTAPHFAFAAGISGLDYNAEKLYRQLLNVGKWIIVFKGGFDIIKHMTNGDLDSAKKSFLGYAVTYSFLWGLPYIMDSLDDMFGGMMPAGSPLGGK